MAQSPRNLDVSPGTLAISKADPSSPKLKSSSAPPFLNNPLRLPHHSKASPQEHDGPVNTHHPEHGYFASHTPLEGSASPKLTDAKQHGRHSELAADLQNGAPVTPEERAPPAFNVPAANGAPFQGKPGVQFANDDTTQPATPSEHTRRGSTGSIEVQTRSRQGFKGTALMSKLKSFSGTSGTSTPKSPSQPGSTNESQAVPKVGSPSVTRSPNHTPVEEEERDEGDADADADAEETADEANGSVPTAVRRKRRRRRPLRSNLSISSPISKLGFDTSDFSSGTLSRMMGRRGSVPDDVGRGAISEGDQEMHRSRADRTMSRGNSWWQAPMNPEGEGADEIENQAVVGRRLGHLRRSTVWGGGGLSDGEAALTPRRPFFNHMSASTYGAQKWKHLKKTFKLMRQKKQDGADFYKSAELMAELRAGAPAALILASMIQRDEHGNKRIPVLLEQLKLKVTDSSPPASDGGSDRHSIFTISLEYGNGPSRMSWTVVRSITEVLNMHTRYKFQLKNDQLLSGRNGRSTRNKQPHFPYRLFPFLRKVRKGKSSAEEGAEEGAEGEEDDDEEEEAASQRGEDTAAEDSARRHLQPEGYTTEGEEARGHGRRRSRGGNLMGNLRRRSTGVSEQGEPTTVHDAVRQRKFVEKQRRSLEKYLNDLIRWLMFRADSNRLCRFLELSALGVRLAAEGSYHGKEGYLHIQSSKGLDFRRVLTPAKIVARHSRKWFLVRQSYIVCVDSPENMNVYDVYLVDNKFKIMSKKASLKRMAKKGQKTEAVDLTVEPAPGKHHTLTLETTERKVRLFSNNQSLMKDFEDSINDMLKRTAWYAKKRFDSFAPPRSNVFAQWLVDGRDYMWNVSRAINMARDVIYIHDWWLSPELYMRRPAAISQKWRLDRLLQKKAREGVKIFVIVYRNVEAAIPIDSEYTKFSLLNLHPNIFIQRSPNQFKKNQFFFAHHEKICVVDHDVAFVGGIDLCFGRWDTPQHPITDDRPTGFEAGSQVPKDAEHVQLFPGKDYSNPRVQDFFRLNEPYEEMYDRGKVPRMPWHDVAMQVVGQPARDLTRHFVQRWNYLRRGRKPTRPLPFLLPPPDAKLDELKALGLAGTCEVQILRSATTWSLGISETEHSIQTAYVRMIEDSEHFVYMENQFFVTSTEAYGTKIQNRIGDALVDRIIRAHENDEDWRCVIVIPLMPGFQNTVDEQDGTSVRLILMCQYRSICRGETSIFGRLRSAGIEPEEYINFFSLRQWGIMASDALVTEQLYIHAKTIIVDDRVALIGSANINERSMLGTRDSECAAIVRDTDMITSRMAGKPYQVGRFAHTLRMRLMREHLGLDVDEIAEDERRQDWDQRQFEEEMREMYEGHEKRTEAGPSTRPTGMLHPGSSSYQPQSFNNELDYERAKASVMGGGTPSSTSSSSSSTSSFTGPKSDLRVTGTKKHELDVSGYGADHWQAAERSGDAEGRDSVMVNGREVLVHHVETDGKGTLDTPQQGQHPSPQPAAGQVEHEDDSADMMPPIPPYDRRTTQQGAFPRVTQLPALPLLDDTDIGGPPVYFDPVTGRPTSGILHPMAADIRPPHVDRDCMRDPVDPAFIDEIWNTVALNNTKLYRRVFRCMPDSEVSTWAEYREYVEYGQRFRASMDGTDSTHGKQAETDQMPVEAPTHKPSTSGGAGVSAPGPEVILSAIGQEVEKIPEKIADKLSLHKEKDHQNPKIVVPGEEDGTDINEKHHRDAEEAQENELLTKPKLNTTMSVDHAARGLEAPSPVYSQGEDPFPLLENPSSRHLKRQPSSAEKRDRRTTFSTLDKPPSRDTSNGAPPSSAQFGSVKRRRRATTRGSRRTFSIDDMPSRNDAEDLLNLVQGSLVQFPYNWLLTEEHNGNWGYQVDGVAPLQIYN